jgi:hypothetical protein
LKFLSYIFKSLGRDLYMIVMKWIPGTMTIGEVGREVARTIANGAKPFVSP